MLLREAVALLVAAVCTPIVRTQVKVLEPQLMVLHRAFQRGHLRHHGRPQLPMRRRDAGPHLILADAGAQLQIAEVGRVHAHPHLGLPHALQNAGTLHQQGGGSDAVRWLRDVCCVRLCRIAVVPRAMVIDSVRRTLAAVRQRNRRDGCRRLIGVPGRVLRLLSGSACGFRGEGCGG
jgi:hypothetical protein